MVAEWAFTFCGRPLGFHIVVIVIISMILTRKITFLKGIVAKNRLLFFGSGRVALPSLKVLHSAYPYLQVVTQSSQGQKKISNEVEVYCRENNINWSSPLTNRTDK